MKRKKLLHLVVRFSSSLLAAMLLRLFTPGQSWLEFGAWTIFFIGVQSPWMLPATKSGYNCLNWFKKKPTN